MQKAFKSNNIQEALLWSRTALDVNVKDEHDFTALMWSAKLGFEEVTALLIQKAADYMIQNAVGDTVLHVACQQGHYGIAKRIMMQASLQNNQQVMNVANDYGNTALHYACFHNSQDLAVMLIQEYGCIIGAVNKFGKIPLDFARPSLKQLLSQFVKSSSIQPVVLQTREQEDVEQLQKAKYMAQTKKQFFEVSTKGVLWQDLLWKTDKCDLQTARVNGQVCIVKNIQKVQATRKGVQSQEWLDQVDNMKSQVLVLQKLQHANLMPLIAACFDTNALICVIYEYQNLPPSGQQSGDVIQNTGVLTLQDHLHDSEIVMEAIQVLRWALDLCEALKFIHANGASALNIKSRNITINQRQTIQLFDFGLYNTMLGHFGDNEDKLLEVEWMAPEILRNGGLGIPGGESYAIAALKADVYSFGILLFEMVTRIYPFDGLNSMNIGLKVAIENLRPQIPEYVPTHLKKLIELCWHENVASRPAFADVAKVLAKIIEVQSAP